MTIELQALISSKPEVLSLLSVSLYGRVLDSIIERINLSLGGESNFHLCEMENFAIQKRHNSNFLEREDLRIQKSSQPVISVLFGPGFSYESSNLVDLLRNATDDVLLNWFTSEILEKGKLTWWSRS